MVKIKYISYKINPGYVLYVDGIKVHLGKFGSIESLRLFWTEFRPHLSTLNSKQLNQTYP